MELGILDFPIAKTLVLSHFNQVHSPNKKLNVVKIQLHARKNETISYGVSLLSEKDKVCAVISSITN